MIIGKKDTNGQIIGEIGRFQYVSFDIFDTLIKRTVENPNDVFISAFEKHFDGEKLSVSASDFEKARISAYHKAIKIAFKNRNEEVSIADIYNCLPSEYYTISDELMQAEMMQEIECCIANPSMKEIYNWCLESGKTIFITSDMYLPQQVVEKILNINGYNVYNKLFLSSAINKRKQYGSLYKHILETEKIDSSSLIHIGDNLKIDYLVPMSLGIKAIKIPTKVDNSRFQRKMPFIKKDSSYKQYLKLQSVINNISDPCRSYFYQYGFEIIGPLLYGFCTWLHQSVIEHGSERLFFLSRDGYLMQEAYRCIYGDEAILNSYLYVSRKSLFSPQVWMYPELCEIMKQETPYHYWDVEELCEMLNVDKEYGVSTWEKCGLLRNERIIKSKLVEDERVLEFFGRVKNQMVNVSKRKFYDIVDYLKQENFKGRVAIVDIGWSGASQLYLQRICDAANIDVSIWGMYLGMNKKTVMGNNAVSYIPKETAPSEFCTFLIEFPFTKNEGSTKTYERGVDNVIRPRMSDYEFKDSSEDHYIRDIQEGALCFVNVIKSGYGVKCLNYNTAYRNLRNVTKRPHLSEVNTFGRFTLVNHGRKNYLAEPDTFFSYLKNPKKFKMDLSDSGWKIGFLKKLFKLPLPYDKLLSMMKR